MLGCGRIDFDRLPLGSGGMDDGGRAGSDASRAGDASNGTGGAMDARSDVSGSGGSPGSGGFGGSGGAGGSAGTADASSGVDGAPDSSSDVGDASAVLDAAADARRDTGPAPGCAGGSSPSQTWSFATDLEGWTFFSNNNASAAIRWSGATGNPDIGAIQFDATSGNGLIADVILSLANAVNLNGRRLSAWVMLTTNQSVTINFIAATTLTSTGFGPTFQLMPGTWTCVSFDPAMPVSALAGYDPSQIRWIGLQPSGAAPFRIYVDQIEY